MNIRDEDRQRIAQRIRTSRLTRRWTQDALATAANLSRAQVAKAETGQKIGTDALFAIVRTLDPLSLFGLERQSAGTPSSPDLTTPQSAPTIASQTNKPQQIDGKTPEAAEGTTVMITSCAVTAAGELVPAHTFGVPRQFFPSRTPEQLMLVQLHAGTSALIDVAAPMADSAAHLLAWRGALIMARVRLTPDGYSLTRPNEADSFTISTADWQATVRPIGRVINVVSVPHFG